MDFRLRVTGKAIRTVLALGVSAALLSSAFSAAAMEDFGGAWRHKKDKKHEASRPAGVKASEPPAYRIPVEPLGFAAPSQFYQGLRERLVSLDFLDENRLLFSFRAPGLIRRTPGSDGDERQIRALVLTLPQGGVDAQAVWTLHDTDPYLWMLKDGHFLLRDRKNLAMGNDSLELKPFLTFPGPLLWVEMDPAQQYLVTGSREPLGVTKKPGEVGSPAEARADVTPDSPEGDGQKDIVLRILRRSTGKVMLVSRVRMRVHLPINSQGYLEVLQSTGNDWMLNLNYFRGGSRILGKIESQCPPTVQFVSQTEAMATTCAEDGSLKLVAVSTTGKQLWQVQTRGTEVWPIVVVGPGGTRIARETLSMTHPVGPYMPLSFEDVKGQLVTVYNAADGKVVLTAPADPVLDGGGNVAISPSGRRVAVLDGGSILVYELPPNSPEKPSAGSTSRP